MKPHAPLTACLIAFLTCAVPMLGHAQLLPFRKSPEIGAPAKSPLPDGRRVTEITVEVAWLADPITFPYYLEAKVNAAQQLEVRGYVPTKAVRDHALRIAQVYSSRTVTDSMKEHPALLVRPNQMSSQQLHSSVLASLRAALPKQHQQFKVECTSDGKVYVAGPVSTYDEKIAVSHSLRRLHGCTSVQNLTSVPEEYARGIANPPRDIPPLAQDAPKKPGPFGLPKTNKEPPVVVEATKKPDDGTLVAGKKNGPDGPMLIPGVAREMGPDLDVPGVIKVELPVKTIPVAELEKRIRAACPKAMNVEVTYMSPTAVRILIETRASEVNAIAERVLAMPELKSPRPDLQFKISP